MQINLVTDVRERLIPALDRDATGVGAAVSLAIDDATTRIKERARALVRVGFPGSRKLPTVVRSRTFDAKPGKPPAGYVWSKWSSKKGDRDILLAFATGATIRARDGKFLFVPLDPAPGAKAKARAALEAIGSNPKLALIKTLGGKLALVEKPLGNRGRAKLLGLLVPSVRIPKRLNFEGLEAQADRVLAERLLARLQEKGL